MRENQIETAHRMTEQDILAFLSEEEEKGLSEVMLRRFRRSLRTVYESLPEDKLLTKERLSAWRKSMEQEGFAADTVLGYVKSINRYLDHAGCPELRFPRGRTKKDLTGMTFGYLRAICPTEKRFRNNVVWLCECQCGKTVEVPSTSLLTGNTLSCGCLLGEHLKRVNRFIDGTSLMLSLKDEPISRNAASGYMGVTPKRGKWNAYIKYKGEVHALGSYADLKDAVKARARGKELVMEDARELEDLYEEMDHPKPLNRKDIPKIVHEKKPAAKTQEQPARRRDNTSGYVGVSYRNNRWEARISHKGMRYTVGRFPERAEAIHARKDAEALLLRDPQAFAERYEKNNRTKKADR